MNQKITETHRVGENDNPPPTEDETNFRRWLVEKVKGSSWSTRRDHTLEIQAQRLGIQPDILQQAQTD